ncbi:type I restriction endonuclease [Streptomyces sp. C8S0]|uniref:type I restriction endonuclease n=1 Tax=Streptomyces sp. C8S0 TaxID=2585716 RepID=UPI001D04894D|nr:type I restriction endonuclease [Streptomyces sp. C8S0]
MQVERDEVERPIVAQLQAMGWNHVPGADVGELTADAPFLKDVLARALRRVNRRATDGEPWMDESDIGRAVAELAAVPSGQDVGKANLAATELLLSGLRLNGPSAAHGGSSATVQYVEWHEERRERNEFTVVDQLRVRNRSDKVSVLDVVLFVNGIRWRSSSARVPTWPTRSAAPSSTCATTRVRPSPTTSARAADCRCPPGSRSCSAPCS